MEVTLTLPFLLTCAGVLTAVAGAWAHQQYKMKDLERELDEVKSREATVAPKLASALDNVATVCTEVIRWKETDQKTIEKNGRTVARHEKRITALEKRQQEELLEELRDAGIPASLTAKLETVGSWQAHEVSGEHVAAKSTV
jgi:septal ring factor EnvC (AmiA/AmiB activator)